MIYAYPSELSSSSSKKAELVPLDLVTGSSVLAFSVVRWTMNDVCGVRKREIWGNNREDLETNAFKEKLMYFIEILTIKIT